MNKILMSMSLKNIFILAAVLLVISFITDSFSNFAREIFTLIILILVVVSLGAKILYSCIDYAKTFKKSKIIKGTLLSYRKLDFNEKDMANYELTIQFFSSKSPNEIYKKNFYNFLISEPKLGEAYDIYFDEVKPLKPILISTYNWTWKLFTLLSTGIFVYLIYLIKEIYKKNLLLF